MVDPQRSKLLVGTLKVEKQTSERNEDSPGNNDCQSRVHKQNLPKQRPCTQNSHGILSSTLLESVNLAVANIVVVVGESLIAIGDLSPAVPGVLFTIKRQGRSQSQRKRLAHRTRVELRVHVEGECEGSIVGGASQARHAIVLLGVDRSDREGIFEQERVRHCEIVTYSDEVYG